MENLLIDNNVIDYSKIFYELFISYEFTIRKEYQFLYDDFLNHLISDTEKIINLNYNDASDSYMKYGWRNDYSKVKFKDTFYRHIAYSDWGSKLKHPEKFPELKRNLRKEKLKKILDNGSM